MIYSFFLSHNSADKRIVDEIKRRAEATGVRVYTYEDDVQAGVQLREKLMRAIADCHSLVAVLTRNGVTRPAIHEEIGVALGLKKPIFALVERGVDPTTLTLLQGSEYITLDLNNEAQALLELQRSVTVHMQSLLDEAERLAANEQRRLTTAQDQAVAERDAAVARAMAAERDREILAKFIALAAIVILVIIITRSD